MAALDVNDGTDAWPVTNAYFRFVVTTPPRPWSGPIGQSDLLEAGYHLTYTWLASFGQIAAVGVQVASLT